MGHAIHDFTGKLRQPAVLPLVADYVNWRRAADKARAEGRSVPDAPPIAPISINLDLTTACNFRCDHCIDWDILNTRFKHEEDVLKNSLTEMTRRGLRSVILIGGGEPTVYPGFSDMVRFIKGLGLQVSVVTNGSGNKKIHEIADCLDERDWVRLSLDSGTNETFIRMHKPVNPKITLEGICEWVPRIKEKNPGFDYISMKPFLVRSETGSEVMDPEHAEAELQAMTKRIRASVDECKTLATDSFRVLESTNLRMLEKGNWQDFTRQPKVCHMQALRQVLTPTGLYNCPAHRGIDRARIAPKDAYRDETALAETNRALDGMLESFDASEECKAVTCLYNDVNWWLDGLVKSDEGLDAVALAGAERLDYFL